MDKIIQIKKWAKDECAANGLGWFWDVHLLEVEKCAKTILIKLPKADKEIVMLGVWLHDLQRIRKIDGNHCKIGAVEAEKVMQKFGYLPEKIEIVKEIILAHSCENDLAPKTLEGKILATADAMSHFLSDFYLAIAATGKRDAKSFKKWVMKKIDRDYRKKIFFPFAKKLIAERYVALRKLFKTNHGN